MNTKVLGPIGGTIGVVDVPVPHLTASNMPMRDCIAMAAMQGMLANGGSGLQTLSQAAYIMADAMLKAREQK